MISGIICSYIHTTVNANSEIVLYNIKPARIRQYHIPHSINSSLSDVNSNLDWEQTDFLIKKPLTPVQNILQIKPSDAINDKKYSQPDITYSLLHFNNVLKVPSVYLKQELLKADQDVASGSFEKDDISTYKSTENKVIKPVKDFYYIESINRDFNSDSEPLENDLPKINDLYGPERFEKDHSNYAVTENDTNTDDNLVSVSSDAFLSYVPSEHNHSSNNLSARESIDITDLTGYNFSNYNLSISLSTSMTKYTTQNTISVSTHIYITLLNETDIMDNISTSLFPSTQNVNSFTNSSPSTDSEKKISSGTVAGIVIAVLISITFISSAMIYLLYKKFSGKCTNVVDTQVNSDNGGYLDDSLYSSVYLNNHIELPKESSEEMTSLDNDSFLNSLETMTIQNYWTDNSKNTKV